MPKVVVDLENSLFIDPHDILCGGHVRLYICLPATYMERFGAKLGNRRKTDGQ
jgi:hypothetical protein